MKFKNLILSLCTCLFSLFLLAQKDSLATKNIKIKKKLQLNSNDYNPLLPAKAAFYSAIFPGMGQIYNKKYWKAPIVWAAVGTSLYFYVRNNRDYNRYRNAFKLREQGFKDEFTRDDGTFIISRAGLVNAQRQLSKNKDLSVLVTVLFYVLQIVEASVNAHLLQFNTNDNLSLNPVIIPNISDTNTFRLGLKLNYSF